MRKKKTKETNEQNVGIILDLPKTGFQCGTTVSSFKNMHLESIIKPPNQGN